MEGLAVSIGIARMAIGLLLVVAAISKLRSSGQQPFRDAVLGYDLVSPTAAKFLARWLPRLELIVGLALVGSPLTPFVDVAGFVLILAFTGAVCISLVSGRSNHCGCVGASAEQVQTVQWKLVYRNLVFLAILIADCGLAHPFGIGRLFDFAGLAQAQAISFKSLLALGCMTLLAAGYARAWTSMRQLANPIATR